MVSYHHWLLVICFAGRFFTVCATREAHHWLNGHESEQASGDSEGQGSLVCYRLWVAERRTCLSDWTTITCTALGSHHLSVAEACSSPQTETVPKTRNQLKLLSSYLTLRSCRLCNLSPFCVHAFGCFRYFMQCLSFRDWLVLLSTMPLRLIRVTACVRTPSSSGLHGVHGRTAYPSPAEGQSCGSPAVNVGV